MSSLSNGATSGQALQIPKMCKAGVVTKEGPDFEMAVEMVPVPEPGKKMNLDGILFSWNLADLCSCCNKGLTSSS